MLISKVIPLFDLFLIIAITFAGNHEVIYIPSFFIVWFVLVVYRVVTQLKFTFNEVKIQSVSFVIFLPFYIYGIMESNDYYFSFLQSVLYINAMPLLFRFIKSNMSSMYISVTLLIICLFSFYLGGTQQGVIFGPNILYRIFGVLFTVFFVIALCRKVRLTQFTFVFFLSSISILLTASRGGTLVILAMFLMVLYYFFRYGYLKYALPLLVFFMFSVVVVNWEFIQFILGRAVHFDLNNASEAYRFQQYFVAYAFLAEGSSIELLFGLGEDNRYYKYGLYPHNILVEVLVYNGLAFMFLLFVMLIVVTYLYFNRLIVLLIVFSPIVIGSILSGDLTDNFIVLSIFFMPFLNHLDGISRRIKNYSE